MKAAVANVPPVPSLVTAIVKSEPSALEKARSPPAAVPETVMPAVVRAAA